MKEGLTEVLAILDKSAQAVKTAAAAVAVYNTLLADLKKSGDVLWTTITFGASPEILYDRVKIKNVKKLVKKDFVSVGKAALFDTVGKAVDELGAKLHGTPEEDRPSRVIVFIGTAGVDNASKTFTLDEIKAKVEHQQYVYSWQFVFVGADVYSFKSG
jgi:hypothetical protein